MPENNSQDEVSVTTPAGTFRARGYDTISFIMIAAVAVFGAMLYQHLSEAKAGMEQIIMMNKGVKEELQQLVRQQRLANCIAATPDSQKEQQFMNPNSFCNRL